MHFERRSDFCNLPQLMEKSSTLAARCKRGPTKAPLHTRGVRRFRRKVLGKRKATWMKSSIILVEDQFKEKQAAPRRPGSLVHMTNPRPEENPFAGPAEVG